MNYVDLKTLIDCLTYKTNIHICIDFFDNYGNYKTALPRENVIHRRPFCDYMKSTEGGFEKCYKCRNAALKKAIEGKKAFGGFCFNGLYEYCHPVIEKDCMIALIMVGNIHLPASPGERELLSRFADTLEPDLSEEKCRDLCAILETHIRNLIREYSDEKNSFNPLVRNIYNYIEEFLYNDISVTQIAQAFNYSEKYIGKLFKQQTGMSIREYLNDKRLRHAAVLLGNTKLSVTEISSQSGFNNVTYFNRMFKVKFGLTPGEYRGRM